MRAHSLYRRFTFSNDISTKSVIPIFSAKFLAKRILCSLVMSKRIKDGINSN